jgi:hypothetical protein
LDKFFVLGGNYFWKAIFENYRTSPNLQAAFFHDKSYAVAISINFLRSLLGDFFTNSSVHPALKKPDDPLSVSGLALLTK